MSVWFDEETLTIGDSLRAKIDEGFAPRLRAYRRKCSENRRCVSALPMPRMHCFWSKIAGPTSTRGWTTWSGR